MAHDNPASTNTRHSDPDTATRRRVPLVAVALLALSTLLAPACDPQMLGTTDPVPLSAKYRATGGACQVEVAFSRAVHMHEAATAAYYRLSSGERAIATELFENFQTVAVTFPVRVTASTTVVVGADATVSLPLTVNEDDEHTATLLVAEFPADPAEPIVRLTFDDAIDPDIARDVTRYSLSGTIDHPVRAEVIGCGDQVDLIFDRLRSATQLDIDSLADINGNETVATQATTVLANSEENRPALESVVFSPDDASASIRVTFTEAVDQAAAATTNFLLHPDEIVPTAAAMAPGGRTVVLSFDALDPPASLTVSGIVDLSNNPMGQSVQADVGIGLDQQPPTVSSVGIVEQGEDVVLRVTFSEAVCAAQAATVANYRLIGAGNVELRPTGAVLRPGGSIVDLTFAFVPANASLIATGICDLSGKSMEEVSTALDSNLDDLPPSVISITFTPDAADPSVDVVFDEPVDSISAQAVENYTFTGGDSPIEATLQDDQRTVRLRASTLAVADTLSITGVSDEVGHVIAPVQDHAIAGGDDDTAPTISEAAFVPDQATPTIEVIFSEAVDRLLAESISNYTATSPPGAPQSANLQAGGRTVRLRFGPLDRSTGISVSGVTDLAGQVVATGPTPVAPGEDENVPKPLSARFIAGASVPTVDLLFSEGIDRALAQTPGLFLAGTDRVPPTSSTLQKDGRTVRLLFPPIDTSDTLSIQSIADLSGRFMDAVDGFKIDLATDSEAPFVLSARFTANALVPTVRIEFSEAVDESSAEKVTNYRTLTGTVGPTLAVLQNDSRTVELTFPPIEREDRIGIIAVQDFAGQTVADNLDTAITPDIELIAPTVVSATVNTGSKVVVVFSESVDESTGESAANYSGFPGNITTLSASLQEDGRTVVLTLQGGTISTGNAISVTGVTDLNGNVLAQVGLILS